MKRVLAQIWGILTKDQRKGILLLLAASLFLALLDTVTVALMAPFMTLMTNLSGYDESMFGKFMSRTFGVTSTEQAILALTVGFIVLYVVRGVCKILYQFWQARKVAGYRAELATRLFSNIMHKPYAYHLVHNTAETQRLVNNDVYRVFMILNSLVSSASYLLTVIGIVIVLLSMNVVLTGILFALIAAFMLWVRIGLKKKIDKAIADGKPDLNMLFIYNMPFRGMAKMMGGMVSMDMADDILFIVNGHFFRGCGRLIHHFFHRPKLYLAKEEISV